MFLSSIFQKKNPAVAVVFYSTFSSYICLINTWEYKRKQETASMEIRSVTEKILLMYQGQIHA